jgi:hypothetical protein
LNQRLYRDKFKLMTLVTESPTREADIAKAISTIAETPEGRKHLETYVLEDFEGFFDRDRPATDKDSDDEECPSLEDSGDYQYKPNFDLIMDKIFAKVYREIQAEEELANEQRGPSPPVQPSALPSASAEPVQEASTMQPVAPTPVSVEPVRDPILDDVLAGRSLSEHLRMFEISDAELDLSRQLLNGEVDVNTAMRQLAEMFQGALPRFSSPGGRIVDI